VKAIEPDWWDRVSRSFLERAVEGMKASSDGSDLSELLWLI
jgi:hypothetical protein